MKTVNTSIVSDLFNINEFTFDDGDKVFQIDLGRIAELLSPENPDGIEAVILEQTVLIMLKDLVHRSSWAKGIDASGKDETDRLIAVMTGTAAAGRFKVTDKDRDKATKAMKQFKMAPEQFKKQYFTNNGMEYVDDFDELARRYMNRRAAEAKAAESAL